MTTTTEAVDQAQYYILVFCALMFFAIVFFMVLFVVRYRKSRNPRATELHGNAWFEVAAFVLPTLLALTMFYYGLVGYQFLRRVPQGALQVAVHSRQFSWSFVYPDGKSVPELVVPSGSDVRLDVTSDDVLHGFYIPALRIQIDAVPGMPTHAWFRAKEVGSYDILCTVYCGTAHSAMLSKLYVLPPAEYEKWKAGDEIELDGEALPLVMADGNNLLSMLGCLNCHSTDGSAGIGPSFKGLYGSQVSVIENGAKRSFVVDDAYLAKAIREPHANLVVGFDDLMPSLASTVRAEDVDDLVKTIKTF